MSEKPNCYECKHRGNVPGSCHSSCNHPAFDEIVGNPIVSLMAILGGTTQFTSDECQVVGNPHGIRNGWFAHPMNFDPVWLESCTGFEQKTEATS